MSCSYIKFNNKSCNDIIDANLLLCHVDYSDDAVAISREIKTGEVNYLKPRVSHYGVSYSESPIYKIGLMKSDYTNFTLDEKRSINKWLTSTSLPVKLELFSDNWDSDIYWKCVVSEISYNRIIGTQILTISFKCDSEFAYKTYTNTYLPSQTSFTIPCDSDIDDLSYIYPTIKITPNQTGNLTITNTSDNSKSFTIAVDKLLDITIDCQNYRLTDNAGNVLNIEDLFIEDDDTDIYWFRLVMGNNIIKVTGGTCTFSVYIENMLKVGVPDEFSI